MYLMLSTRLTWHSVSSGRLLQVWRQAILAAQDGFERHLANSILHGSKEYDSGGLLYNFPSYC